MVSILLFIGTLLYIEFPNNNTNTLGSSKNQISKAITILNNEIVMLVSLYDKDKLSAGEYLKQFDDLIARKKILLFENEIKENSEGFFGRRSARFFLVGFAIRLPYLLFSIIISLLIVRIRTNDKNLFRTFFVVQISCYSIALYELVSVFWNFQDYSIETYRVAVIIMSLFIGFLCSHAFKSYESNVSQNEQLKSSFLNFIVEIRNKHYEPILRKAMIQGLYDGEYQKEIELETKAFEKRLRDKAEELCK